MDEKKRPETASNGQRHRFLKNDRYFTLCVYVFLLVLLSAVAIKAIFSFGQTRAFFAGLFRALAPFLIALLIAYILTPFAFPFDRVPYRDRPGDHAPDLYPAGGC